MTRAMAKQLHFNKNMEALKKLQAGVDKLSSVVGVTLGPKVGGLEPVCHIRQVMPCHACAAHAAGNLACLAPCPDAATTQIAHHACCL